jgi:uncharacterized protein YfkK (UPF0435 family)
MQNSFDQPTLNQLKKKLADRKIKVATIISLCEDLDANNDNLIHIEDLNDVFIKVLGKNVVSRREMKIISSALSTSSKPGVIEYKKLLDLMEESSELTERWYGDDEEEQQMEKGSVGEWLKKAACPAEVKNFQKFIACLEDYERSSGMKCVCKNDGFVLPLGPDLKVSVNFLMG